MTVVWLQCKSSGTVTCYLNPNIGPNVKAGSSERGIHISPVHPALFENCLELLNLRMHLWVVSGSSASGAWFNDKQDDYFSKSTNCFWNKKLKTPTKLDPIQYIFIAYDYTHSKEREKHKLIKLIQIRFQLD